MDFGHWIPPRHDTIHGSESIPQDQVTLPKRQKLGTLTHADATNQQQPMQDALTVLLKRWCWCLQCSKLHQRSAYSGSTSKMLLRLEVQHHIYLLIITQITLFQATQWPPNSAHKKLASLHIFQQLSTRLPTFQNRKRYKDQPGSRSPIINQFNSTCKQVEWHGVNQNYLTDTRHKPNQTGLFLFRNLTTLLPRTRRPTSLRQRTNSHVNTHSLTQKLINQGQKKT